MMMLQPMTMIPPVWLSPLLLFFVLLMGDGCMAQSPYVGTVMDRVSLTTGLALLRGECGRVTLMLVVAVVVLLGALLSSGLISGMISMIFVAVILLMITDELGA